ncbi:MAG: hypothetical protein HYV40_06555 [Candidatus Levybacteria bacterium]|nr:hypothetical protein [Candidatus Levybacteria bacterium]
MKKNILGSFGEHILHKKYLLLVFYVMFYACIGFVLSKKMGAFGCFDDCPNIMAGWFVLKGKVLYEQVFYNHQPLIVYISQLVQYLGKPESIYHLILYHRLSLFLFSFAFGILLILRFRVPAFLFLIFYESTKYYFFGDRFLAEAFIVYPAIYLAGIVWGSLSQQVKHISRVDVIFGTFCAWFIFYMREPYAPLALLLFLFVLIKAESWRIRLFAIGFFLLATFGFLFLFPVSDYFFNVVTVNQQFHLQRPFTIDDVLRSFFYPVVIFLDGKFTTLWLFESFLSAIYIVLIILSLTFRVGYRYLLLLFFSLGFANFRLEQPGLMYYEAFHMLSWYALFLFSLFLLLFMLRNKIKTLFLIFNVVLFCGLAVFLLSTGSYVREKTDPSSLFFEGYNQYYTTGEVVRRLSSPSDTLFLDGWNDLIYWQAQRTSPYMYSWYTSIMPGFMRYKTAREDLLAHNPPDFFYGACKEWPFSRVSQAFLSQYVNISFQGKPTCLYMNSLSAMEVSKAAKERILELGYRLEPGV